MQRPSDNDIRPYIKFWLVPLGITLVILFIYKASAALLLIGISIFLALALKPLVQKVNNLFGGRIDLKKKHSKISAILAYLIVILIIGIIVAVIGPTVIAETSKFIATLPSTFEEKIGGWEGINNFGKNLGIENIQQELIGIVSNISQNIFGNLGSTVVASVSGIADIVTKVIFVLILTLLFLLEGPSIMNSLWRTLGSHKEDAKAVKVAQNVISKMAQVISTYVSHQILIGLIDGSACIIIVFVLSLIFKFSSGLAIPMGMIAMVFYLIPMFGQFIGGALITLVLLFSNPVAAITFIVIYIVYTQIENNLISPKIQGSALRLPAVAILCATIIGMYMFGLFGAIIAIPIAGCIRVLIDEYPNIKSARE